MRVYRNRQSRRLKKSQTQASGACDTCQRVRRKEIPFGRKLQEDRIFNRPIRIRGPRRNKQTRKQLELSTAQNGMHGRMWNFSRCSPTRRECASENYCSIGSPLARRNCTSRASLTLFILYLRGIIHGLIRTEVSDV